MSGKSETNEFGINCDCFCKPSISKYVLFIVRLTIFQMQSNQFVRGETILFSTSFIKKSKSSSLTASCKIYNLQGFWYTA